mgnify:CR=1
GGNTSSSDPPAETADFIESPKRKNATTKVLINTFICITPPKKVYPHY